MVEASGGSDAQRRSEQPAHFPWLVGGGFVLVWSSGYIAGPAAVEAVEPFSLLAIRFVVAAAVLVPLVRWRRGPLRMDRTTLLRVCLVGLAMNGIQFAFMYLAFAAGLGATLGALLHSLSPVLTVVLAGVAARRAGPAGAGGGPGRGRRRGAGGARARRRGRRRRARA